MTTITKPDFQVMTGAQLVEVYNEMVATANDLGVQTAKPVTRFSGVDAGRTRCERLHAMIADLAHDAAQPHDESRPEVSPTEAETAYTRAVVTEDTTQTEKEQRDLRLQHNEASREDASEPETAPPANSGADVADVSFAEMTGTDLQGEGVDDMAKKAKAKTKRAPRAKDGETLHSYTEQWNDLVPSAVKKGIKGVKKHSSDFESYEKAKARIAWLKKEIAKA